MIFIALAGLWFTLSLVLSLWSGRLLRKKMKTQALVPLAEVTRGRLATRRNPKVAA